MLTEGKERGGMTPKQTKRKFKFWYWFFGIQIPEVGQTWKRPNQSPWNPIIRVTVVEIKDGWIRWKHEEGDEINETTIGQFREWFEFVE